MKANSKDGKALLEALGKAKVGQQVALDLPGPFPHIKEPTQAILMEAEPDKFYQLSLYWLGIHLCDTVVEVVGPNLITEVL